uniref:Uncharacterized protein n=1 Tax=Buteo japonicus TaxID=224669 RepID=A0A8C0BGA7_9AVES
MSSLKEMHPVQSPCLHPRKPLVVLLGSMSVGKSSLAYRYVKNDFKELLPTVGCE